MANQDIKVRCYNFSLKILKFISSNEVERKCNPIIDQLLRSSTSIGAILSRPKAPVLKESLLSFQLRISPGFFLSNLLQQILQGSY